MLSTKTRKRRVASYIGAGVVNGDGSPVNTAVPIITGTAQVGQTLTVTPGTWSGDPVLTYQWYADGVVISAATDATYVPVVGDIGAVVTVSEAAVNDKGSAIATSAGTVAVIAAE